MEPVTKPNQGKLDYGNWVTKRLLYGLGALGIVFLALAVLYLPLISVSALFFVLFAYFAYARYMFSPQGGNLQNKTYETLLSHLNWYGQGQALDIGCGNAPLTIKIAQKFPSAHVTGIDYWGGIWEYSKDVCEQNAQTEQVADRVTFQKASASALPFEDGYFEAAVTNLVFHNISDTKDKRELIKEALRVVKKGGVFAFQDLFLVKKIYGDMDDLLETIRGWGVENVEFFDTSKAEFIPWALRLPFMLGTVAIIYGKK
jgi:SAM-dependent methyltransferase